jgi:hypothetical protein
MVLSVVSDAVLGLCHQRIICSMGCRCGMSTDSLVGMRESIVKAMADFVELESDEAVEVSP